MVTDVREQGWDAGTQAWASASCSFLGPIKKMEQEIEGLSNSILSPGDIDGVFRFRNKGVSFSFHSLLL